MTKWTDLAALLYGVGGAATPTTGTIMAKLNILNGDKNTDGSILYTQEIVNGLTALEDSLDTAYTTNVNTTTLTNAINSVVNYLDALGDGSTDSKLLNDIKDVLNANKDIYNNYVEASNAYNDSNGTLQTHFSTLDSDYDSLITYTGVTDTTTQPTAVSGTTLSPITRSVEFDNTIGYFSEVFAV